MNLEKQFKTAFRGRKTLSTRGRGVSQAESQLESQSKSRTKARSAHLLPLWLVPVWLVPVSLGAAIFLLFFAASPLRAQRDQREPLNATQQEQIAEAGIDPDARIALYTKFTNEHAQTIEGLGKRHEAGRGRRLDGELQDFATLIDELSSNLDEYGDRKADMRKALKVLNEALPRWQGILHGLPNDSAYEVSRNDAGDALSDLTDLTKKLTADQEAYFKEHKDAKGQDREEPQ